jgi:hypothetical protein
MKRKNLTILFICLQTILFAQNYKFGKVSKEEIEEKFYPLDSTADAAYLNKYERRYYDFNGSDGITLVTEIVERIKIYNKEGFKYATKSIAYYDPDSREGDRLGSIKAYTYFLDGENVEKVKLDKDNIFKERVNSVFSRKKITMPNVKEGVVIEIKYTNRSKYYTSIDDIDFQYAIPVKNFYCQLEIPEIFGFNKRSKGYYMIPMQQSSKISQIQDLNIDVFKFEDKNIPALNDKEPFVYSYNDYRGGIEFELTSIDEIQFGGRFRSFSTSWSKVTEQIYKSSNFGGELKKGNVFKDNLTTVIGEASSDAEKTFLIFNHIKNKIKWNGNYGKYTQKGLKKAYQESVGNVADINLALVAMLREAGINANPVLVSTKSNGTPIFPTIKGFNYVICMVDFPDNKYMLLDATEPYSAPNLLPVRDLNWKGRKILKNGSSTFVNLTSNKYDTEDNIVNVKITDDMIVEGIMRTKLTSLGALSYRNKNNGAKEEGIINKLEEKRQIEIEDFKVINSENLSKPIVRNISFSSEDIVEEINGKIYIEPLLFLAHHENPFKKEERTYPIDYVTKKKYNNSVSIQIPEGYKVAQLPAPIAIGLPDKLGVFKYQISQRGNLISTRCVLQINQSLVVPAYYPYLKGFYNEMVKKESEKIVLERI